MNTQICAGSFLGGEIEPGTFHGPVMVDPLDEERDDIAGDTDTAPMESEG